jgi:hypothetical protein
MTDQHMPHDPGQEHGPDEAKSRRPRLLVVGVSAFLAGGLLAGLVAATVPAGGRPRPATDTPGVGYRPPGPNGLEPPARLTGALVSFNGCADYLTYVRDRAEALVGPNGLQTTTQPSPYAGGRPGGVLVAPANAGMAGGGLAAGASQAAGPAAVGAPTAAASAPAQGYSQTNDQVAGVDEPDTVKTDGHVVVTLEGATLRVLDPAAHVLGSLQLAGDTGGGLLLAGSRALVFSSPATAIQGTTTAAASSYLPTSGGFPGQVGPTPPLPTAHVAVVDLTDPSNPQLVRTFQFDGGIVAARLVGPQVRLVLRSDGPNFSFGGSSSSGNETSATAANKRLIADSTVADWLPSWQTQTPNGAMTARQPLTACDSVVRPAQASGVSTVTVLSLDPQSSTPGPGTSVVAAGDIVYATADRLYVAGPSADSRGQTPPGQPYGCCSLAPPVGATTRIYAFDTPPSGAASFAGVGTVPGWLVNSYAMDEASNGLLRVASTSESTGGTSQSQITVLAPSGGELTTVGVVSGLGAGEFVRAVRFLGDQAYVVTFRTFDPLYVVNLTNPAKPVLSGELDQPGFSEFLYPLPDHRLLGVGVQLTDNEPSGLVVATYDVSDPTHPRRIDVSNLAVGFYSQNFDPHAFLYWPPADLALLAVPNGEAVPAVANGAGPAVDNGAGPAVDNGAGPAVDNGQTVQGSSGVAAYQIGATGTLTRTATLGYGGEAATRSVVIGDQVWVTTPDGVVTSALTNLPATTWHPY